MLHASETKLLRLEFASCEQHFPCRSGLKLCGTAQGTESLVNQAEKRFERIGRAEFDVDTPSARFEPSCNVKSRKRIRPIEADSSSVPFKTSACRVLMIK